VAQVRGSPEAMHEKSLPSDLVITGAHFVEAEVRRRVILEGINSIDVGNTASCMYVR
jgi:hypothetical protein